MSKTAHKNIVGFIAVLASITIVGSTVSLLFFWYLFQTGFPQLGYYFDTVVPEITYHLRTPILTNILFIITLFGADFTLLLGVFAIYYFQRIHRHRESIIFTSAVVFGLLLNTFLKLSFQRMRPDIAPLISMDSFSYPSGHAMNAFVFYGLLAYYLIVFTKRELLEVVIAVFSISMIILVGISRVYLGVHYPTDVIAGFFAGVWVLIAAVYAHKHRKTLFK